MILCFLWNSLKFLLWLHFCFSFVSVYLYFEFIFFYFFSTLFYTFLTLTFGTFCDSFHCKRTKSIFYSLCLFSLINDFIFIYFPKSQKQRKKKLILSFHVRMQRKMRFCFNEKSKHFSWFILIFEYSDKQRKETNEIQRNK